MYVQDYSVLYNNAVRPVICDGSEFNLLVKSTCTNVLFY